MNLDKEKILVKIHRAANSTAESPKSQRRRSFLSRLLSLFFRSWARKIQVDEESIEALRQAFDQKLPVSVISNASIFEYLLLSALFEIHGLPWFSYSNAIPRILYLPISELFKGTDIHTRLENDEPGLLFLNQSRSFSGKVRWSKGVWEDLLESSKSLNKNIAPIPFVFLWGRQPDRLSRSLLDLLFGDTLTPGKLRKLGIALRYGHRISLRVGKSVDMDRFHQETSSASTEIQAKKLRRLLANYMYREKKLLVGPPLRSRKRIVRSLLKDPSLIKLVAGVSRREKISKDEAWRRCQESLYELISDYSGTVIALTYQVYRWLVSRLYKKIEIDHVGLNRVKEVIRDYPVILIPSHKSHVDYILMAGLFYENNLSPPHVAAGVNLNFWPIGMWFRKTGAFFIRRKIAGDLLYVRLLTLYIRWLIRNGYSQEFFIEGGRSRTGKLVFPKHGLLSMQVDAYLTGACKDLFIVPVSITYDRVVEERAYRRELRGEEKKRESVFEVFRARQLLRHQHGHAYIRFSKPLSVKKFFSSHEKVSARIRKQGTQKIAGEVARAIAKETVVTAASLFATALLSTSNRGVTASQIFRHASLLKKFAKTQEALFSETCQDLEKELPNLIDFFEETRKVDVLRDSKEPVVLIQHSKRISLDYYKNTIFHFLLPASIYAASFLRGDKSLPIEDGIKFLLSIFRGEFFLPPNLTEKSLTASGVSFFGENPNREDLLLFKKLLMNYLDAYHLTVRMAEENQLTGTFTEKNIQESLKLGRKLLALGEISHPEALSSAYLQSASHFLSDQKLELNSEKLSDWKTMLQTLRETTK